MRKLDQGLAKLSQALGLAGHDPVRGHSDDRHEERIAGEALARVAGPDGRGDGLHATSLGFGASLDRRRAGGVHISIRKAQARVVSLSSSR